MASNYHDRLSRLEARLMPNPAPELRGYKAKLFDMLCRDDPSEQTDPPRRLTREEAEIAFADRPEPLRSAYIKLWSE